MELFLWAAGAVLILLGAAELARMVVFWATRPAAGEGLILVAAPAGAEDCEALVRAAMERARWLGGCRLVCVVEGEDPELMHICSLLAAQYPDLRVCKKDDLVYHIREE